MKTDLRNITTQEDLEYLFSRSNFSDEEVLDDELKINDSTDDNGEPYQIVWIPECCYIGSLMTNDFEGCGEDYLFVRTIIRMFAQGKLKVVE